MIELRWLDKKLYQGQAPILVLQYRTMICQLTDGKPDTSKGPIWSDWRDVPTVSEE